ncbi:22518_t:CDS:2, partial [Cetraspora pellucida]
DTDVYDSLNANQLQSTNSPQCFKQSHTSEVDEYKEMLSGLNQSLEMNPCDLLALRNRGFTSNDDKIVCNKMLGIRGIIYREMGRYEESLIDLNKALEIIPNDALML